MAAVGASEAFGTEAASSNMLASWRPSICSAGSSAASSMTRDWRSLRTASFSALTAWGPVAASETRWLACCVSIAQAVVWQPILATPGGAGARPLMTRDSFSAGSKSTTRFVSAASDAQVAGLGSTAIGGRPASRAVMLSISGGNSCGTVLFGNSSGYSLRSAPSNCLTIISAGRPAELAVHRIGGGDQARRSGRPDERFLIRGSGWSPREGARSTS
ncbi:hypothetical protein [Nonomuraea sp. NPDC052265]|uniref:hypothetical protein n=1 Tax=Nonomuraea sp. NPDC052265 TaxID=3364374 RepID=UPI0037C5256A